MVPVNGDFCPPEDCVAGVCWLAAGAADAVGAAVAGAAGDSVAAGAEGAVDVFGAAGGWALVLVARSLQESIDIVRRIRRDFIRRSVCDLSIG